MNNYRLFKKADLERLLRLMDNRRRFADANNELPISYARHEFENRRERSSKKRGCVEWNYPLPFRSQGRSPG